MGATLTDTVTVSSVDGTVQSIAITITGTNDAFITGAVTGSVTEDVLVDEAAPGCIGPARDYGCRCG